MKRHLSTAIASIFLVGAFSSSALAEERSFTFGVHEARTNISFVGEADIETIHGFTNQLVGSVKSTDSELVSTATLKVDVKTLDTGIALRDEHLQGEMWLDAANHPYIELELTKVTRQASTKKWAYEGTLTIKGKSQKLSGEAKIKFVDEDKASKFKLGKGEWVNVKVDFDVKLTDFGVAIPEGVGSKVSDQWTIQVDIWGTTSPDQS